MPAQSPWRSSAAGFTIVELVTVVLLLGTLSVVAFSRMVGRDDYAPAMIEQQFVAQGRYAQLTSQARATATVTLNVSLVGDSWRFSVDVDGASTSSVDVNRDDVDIRLTNGASVTNLASGVDLLVQYDGRGDVATLTIGGVAGVPQQGLSIEVLGGSTRSACLYPTGYLSHGLCT